MKRKPLRLLSIDITAKGFGFALLDAKRGLLDWGFCPVPASNDFAFLTRVAAKVQRGRPTAIVVENFAVVKGRENAARRREIVVRIAAERNLGMCHVSREVVRRVFGVGTKAEIVRVLAERFPELQSRIPPARTPWSSEDERMHIFDALSFAAAVIAPANLGSRGPSAS
jgi:hypothetical protein